MTFAEQLHESRNEAGLSIAAGAILVGVSPRTWAYWETGHRVPPSEAEAITQERVLSKLGAVKCAVEPAPIQT